MVFLIWAQGLVEQLIRCVWSPEWARAAGAAFLVALLSSSVVAGDDWEEVSRTGNLAISVRERSGSSIKELKAVGVIDAPPWVVKNVLNDIDGYSKFMPYTVEAKVLSKDASTRTSIVYMKLDPPMVGPRDVTLRIQEQTSTGPDGSSVYNSRWAADNASGPAAQRGVTRMTLDEGSWTLAPATNGKSTKATYSLFTDGGGNLPSFVINLANKRSVAELFDAVRKQVQNDKYRQGQPSSTL